MGLQLANAIGLVVPGLGNESQYPSLAIDDHGNLAVQLAVAQAALNLLRLDPEAANLHLMITPTAQLDPFSRPLCHVSGAIDTQPPAIRQVQVQIAFSGLLRVVQVTQAHTRAGDVQLTNGLFGHGVKVVIENQHLAVGDWSAQRTVAVACLEFARGNQHRGFGGPVEVVELALAAQLFDDPRLADIAAGHHMIQALQLFQREDAQQGRR